MVTSWFWLVGIVVLSLLPPLIKTLIGGDEDTVTAYLALFSIAVGLGSGLAAASRAGASCSRRRLSAPCCSACSRWSSGWRRWASRRPYAAGPAAVFATPLGMLVAVLFSRACGRRRAFIVPAFAAVQAWSGADHRARTVAAVNVLNAAFMTGATVLVALMQKFGATVPLLFLLIGMATLVVALAIWKTMPKRPSHRPR